MRKCSRCTAGDMSGGFCCGATADWRSSATWPVQPARTNASNSGAANVRSHSHIFSALTATIVNPVLVLLLVLFDEFDLLRSRGLDPWPAALLDGAADPDAA